MSCRIQHAGPAALHGHHGHTTAARAHNVSSLSAGEQARAEKLFEDFCAAVSLKHIVGYFQQFCECVKLRPNDYRTFYGRMRERMSFSWKWKHFQNKLDKRAAQKEYGKGQICSGNKVLIVGAGPCGLRMAVEAALLGAKVVVVEKRDRFSRNNVLHLWPFVITDLLNLGAKKFYPKFCSGNVDHISIRILQCILLKMALLLGVEFHYGVSFINYIEPPEYDGADCTGWRAEVHPADHTVASYEFDVLVGADGRRNTLQGFQRKVFRGMLAIAITTNFINRNTAEENRVEEISGVARIYNQQFFRDLYNDCGIDLENIVYYRDATHYFVMTAKKASLLAKGVLRQDFMEVEKLLHRDNIDRQALNNYALEAAKFSTGNRLPAYDFAINPHGDPDVSVFDFTNMYAAENACRIVERRGHRLMINLVGDSLIEPFWPLGTGCAHGFLGVLDAAWMLRFWGLGTRTPLQMIVEREAIYRSLSSIKDEHLLKNYSNYSIDPVSRYVHIDISKAKVFIVRHLLDTDCPEKVDKSELADNGQWKRTAVTGHTPKRLRQRRDTVSESVLVDWCAKGLASRGITVDSVGQFWTTPLPLCALIHHFRPELLENYYTLDTADEETTWNLILTICENQLGIEVPFTAAQILRERENIDREVFGTLLLQFYDLFRREIPGEFVANVTMDASPSLEADLPRRAPAFSRKTPSSPTPASPVSSKRRHITGQEMSKRRRPSNKSDLSHVSSSLSHKRRTSMEQIQVNMGEKIKFLEAAFNPLPSRAPPAQSGAHWKSSDNLAERKEVIEQKIRGSSLHESVLTESKEKFPAELVEEVRREFRDKGAKGLEGRYPAELVKLVVFQDRKREMLLKLAGDDGQSKFAAIDEQLARADSQLRDGSALSRSPRGHGAVSSMADDYRSVINIAPVASGLSPKKSPLSPHNLTTVQASNSECYFCHKRVYLAERKSVEGLFFHRTCFKCHHCNKMLPLTGDYSFDRYDPGGAKFYCPAHFKFRKHDFTLLQSPQKSPSSPHPLTPLTPPSAVPSPLQHFQRFPSREDILCASPVPSLASSRYLDDDDSGEDDLDEDNVLTHNFGGTTIETGGGSASDSDDMERVIDGDAAEMEVEEWRRKRVGKMLRERGESGSNTDSSWESGEPVQNAYDDSSEPLCNAYDSSSDDSDSDADLPATVVKVPSEERPAFSPPPTRFSFDILPHSSEKPHPNDLHNVPTIFAKDYTQSRSSPLTSVRSDESDTFFTPKYSLSPQPTFPSRKPEIKWDQTVLETSRRLRELRMTGRDTPSRTGCESADDVFHTPRTSFHERDAEYRPGTGESKVSEGSDGGSCNYGNNLVPSGSGTDPVSRKLSFDSPPREDRNQVKQRLLSATQERKAEARARAKLKTDEELKRNSRLRGSSSSEGSDAGRTSTGAKVMVGGALKAVDSSSSDDAEAIFERRTAQIHEKNFKQDTTKILHRAQEVQRLIEETQVRIGELDEKAAQIERALKGDVLVNDSEQQLQSDWFALLDEQRAANRQLQELKLTAEKLQLEDRARRAQEQLRLLMGIDDSQKNDEQKADEARLMNELMDIRYAKMDNEEKLKRLPASSGNASVVNVR